MPKFYKEICKNCGKEYIGRGKYYCSNKCASKIENKKKSEKISKSMKGKVVRGRGWKHSEDWKKKASERMKNNNPLNNPETIKKIKKSLKERWDKIGRKSKRIRDTDYLLWRGLIFERDKFTCKKCGQIGGYLEAHHIKSWSRYPELRLKLNNGLTLCKKCHKETYNYGYKKN